MRVTVEYLAELAGVSRGTVDRVLNNRPYVKPEIREKVLALAKDLNYKPHKLARALAYSSNPITIGVIIPLGAEEFFGEIRKGFLAAESDLKDYGVKIVLRSVSNEHPEECLLAMDEFVKKQVNGIAMTAMNNEQIIRKINRFVSEDIPVVTYNSDIPGSKRMCFVGQDLYKSGRVAAGLMAKCVEKDSHVLAVLTSFEFQAHKARISGFIDRLKELDRGITIADYIQTFDKYQVTYDNILAALRKNPDITGIYMAGEYVLACVAAVRDFASDKKIHIICNDVLPYTRKLLEDGSIDFTVSQDPYTQGYKPIKILTDYILEGKKPENELLFTEVNVLLAESF